MKQVFKWLIKAAAAGLIALGALCLWCALYYNVPVHYTNETGATEYRWESSKFYRKGTEGFAFGRTNNDGFNNLKDFTPGERIDVLLMGSSHMEAMNVSQDENTAARLNDMLGGEKYVYNIGVSGHTLMYCLKHLEDALSTYGPREYVVIETRDVGFPQQEMEQVLEGSLPDIPSQSGGLIGLVQKLPYLRLFYTKHVKGADDVDAAKALGAGQQERDDEKCTELMGKLMEMLSTECSAAGVRPIVVYHPTLYVDEAGEAYTQTEEAELRRMQAACEDAGVTFVDLTESFLSAYEGQHRLPYGFLNTAPGKGHMNSFGHSLFAQGVYEAIEETEAGA